MTAVQVRPLLRCTPWGHADAIEEIAPGIHHVETASHGGFHLDRSRQMLFGHRFPWFDTCAGGPWYEEDCDAAAVVLAFPECFEQAELRSAVCIASHAGLHEREPQKWVAVYDWLQGHSAEAESLRARLCEGGGS